MPRSRKVKQRQKPEYEEFHSITRCLHLRDAMICYGKQKLRAHKVSSTSVEVNAKVLWFAPTQSMDENNFYGNVSFSIPLEMAISRCGAPKYYLDQGEIPTHSYTRILMTKKEHINLERIDYDDYLAPLIMEGSTYYAATQFTIGKTSKLHILELGIEADIKTQKWLYNNCVIETNSHTAANTLLPRSLKYHTNSCHRYNSYNLKCPSPYTKTRTRNILLQKCPEMLSTSCVPEAAYTVSNPLLGKKKSHGTSPHVSHETTRNDTYKPKYEHKQPPVVQYRHEDTESDSEEILQGCYFSFGDTGSSRVPNYPSSHGDGYSRWSGDTGGSRMPARSPDSEGWSTCEIIIAVACGLALLYWIRK